MEDIKKVGGFNLLILIVYMIITNVGSTGPERELAVAVIAAMLIVFHVGLNVVVAIVFYIKKNNKAGSAFLLSAGLVLVIGFSACLGSVSM